jgi:hypothetical protein
VLRKELSVNSKPEFYFLDTKNGNTYIRAIHPETVTKSTAVPNLQRYAHAEGALH